MGNKVGVCSCVGTEELGEEKSVFVNVSLLYNESRCLVQSSPVCFASVDFPD